jgi:broad specificity phosphatase PhoE
MKPIIVVRHAHPADNHIPIASHWADAALSEMGLKQAECVAARLKADLAGQNCRIWASDLLRAWQTAAAIGRAMNLPVKAMPGLREYKDGLKPEVTEEELRKYVPADSPATFDLLANRAGESWPDFYNRVAASMDEIAAEAERDDVMPIVVAHYGANGNIVNWWLKLDLTGTGDTPLSFEATLASITVLKLKPTGKRCLERLNDIAHLYACGLLPESGRLTGTQRMAAAPESAKPR